MQILHVLDHSIPIQSGYTFRTLNILKGQQELGYKIFPVTSIKQLQLVPAVENVDGITFYRSDYKTIFSKLPFYSHLHTISTLKQRLLEVAAQYPPDIIHAHSPALNGIAAYLVAKKLKIPLVYEVRAFWEDAAVDHGTHSYKSFRYNLSRKLETYVLKNANAITTICEGLKTDITARGIDNSKITVVPNSVDIKKFTFNEPLSQEILDLKAKFNLTGHFTIGFIGSLYAYEGVIFLIKAMTLFKQSNLKIKLLIIGGGPQFANLKKLALSSGLENDVLFLGRVPHQDVSKYYQLIDLFVYPRTKQRITDLVTPLKPLEAMARGKLVLASDVGGHKELITDGQNGFLFKAEDLNDLANKVKTIMYKPDLANLIQSARTYVEQQRNWDTTVQKYKGVYEPLIS